MAHPSKAKGNGFEREIVDAAKAAGFESKRAWGSNGEALGCHETVDVLINDKKIQCKRIKTLAKWLRVNEHQDAVITREDRGETYVLLKLDEYFKLLGRKDATTN